MLCPCIHHQKQNCFLVYHLGLCRFWTTFWYQPSNWKIIFIPWTVVWARDTNQYIARTRSILIFQKIAISILKIRLICIPGLGKSSSHQPQPENGYKDKIWFDSLPWFEIFQVFEVINLISEFILDVNAHNLPICFSFVNHGKNTKSLDFISIQNSFKLRISTTVFGQNECIFESTYDKFWINSLNDFTTGWYSGTNFTNIDWIIVTTFFGVGINMFWVFPCLWDTSVVPWITLLWVDVGNISKVT